MYRSIRSRLRHRALLAATVGAITLMVAILRPPSVAGVAPAATPTTVIASTETVAGESSFPIDTPAPTATVVEPAVAAAQAAVILSAVRVTTPTPVPRPPLPAKDDVAAQIAKMTVGQRGRYALCVLDIASQQTYGFDADTQSDAASLNKVVILAVIYQQAAMSRIDLDRIVTTTPDDIQDYGTGSIRYDPVGSSYSVRTLARLMIEQSDNTASYMLAQLVGLSTIQSQVTSWGMRKTLIGEDMTSARDITILFNLIYHNRIAPPKLTGEMIDFLTHTDFRDRIPALLPTDVRIGHKIGNHVGVLNDGGIVFLAGRPYVIVILNKDIDEARGLLLEQQISKAVYDFQSSLPAVPS